MATRRQPLIPGWLIPGVSATTLVVAVALAAFLALWWNAPQDDWVAVWQDSYLWHVVRFSFWQAFLSALLSVVPAIFLARALYRRRFPGRLALLRLCAMTLILPVLVAVFGILSVYGRQGWLATLCQSLGLEWTFSPYGLQGILLAHVFLIYRWRAAYYSRHWKTFPANNVSLPPSLGCAAGIFPLRRMAVVTATNPAGCCTYLYALFRQLRHRAIAGRRSAGNHYRAGNLSGAELRLRSCPRGDAGADPDGVLPRVGAAESAIE
ncbi:thiamine transport system permease protein ThiP [Escherichia coli TA008]|nr:thiamine transport system permease protein ThiP [Escherichia coli TA008]